jgi:hypothetical protein
MLFVLQVLMPFDAYAFHNHIHDAEMSNEYSTIETRISPLLMLYPIKANACTYEYEMTHTVDILTRGGVAAIRNIRATR